MNDSSSNAGLKRRLKQNRRTTNGALSRQLDWDRVRQRIAASQTALLTLDDDAPEVLAHIWAQRAEQLAQLPTPEVTGEQLQVTAIRLRQEVYGLPVQYVRGVALARSLTRVPRVPAWVAGVVSQHGRVVSVIDLQRFIGMEPAAHDGDQSATEAYLVSIETAGMEIALLVDEVLAVETILVDHLRAVESAPQGFRTEYVQGVVRRASDQGQRDLLIVLNLPVLLSDKRLIVNESL